jgi:tol-pal system protein YbgF
MKDLSPTSNGVLLAALLVAMGAPFFVGAAESPITVESRSVEFRAGESRTGEPATTTAPSITPTQSTLTYRPPVEVESSGMEDQYQLQLLQQEVMALRGLVEELRHELDRVKSVQDDRYLELDARMQQALKNVAASEPLQTETEVSAASDPIIDETLDEKTLYDTSLQLIRNRQYDLAITQLESVIARFPDGQYAPNAYYWLGEVYAAKPNPDYEKARQALAQVITFFPDHRKVPDAAFKLGKVYYLLGDCQRATELLSQVIAQHEGKSVAKLAETYLRETVDCDS